MEPLYHHIAGTKTGIPASQGRKNTPIDRYSRPLPSTLVQSQVLVGILTDHMIMLAIATPTAPPCSAANQNAGRDSST